MDQPLILRFPQERSLLDFSNVLFKRHEAFSRIDKKTKAKYMRWQQRTTENADKRTNDMKT